MVFVNELIKDRQGFTRGQTIDRERNLILRELPGGHTEESHIFELKIGDQAVKFQGQSGMKIHGQPKLGESRQYEMNWDIYRMFIPHTLQEKREEVMLLIEEALRMWGDNYHTERAYSVSVKFSERVKMGLDCVV